MERNVVLLIFMGFGACVLFTARARVTLKRVKNHREIMTWVAAVAVTAFIEGTVATIFPSFFGTKINMGQAGLLIASGFICSVILAEAYDRIVEERPGEMWTFAGIILLVCAAHMPALTSNAWISLMGVQVSCLVMTVEDLFYPGHYQLGFLTKK